jgi:putative membrane protein insertion efficiency factor
MPKFQRIFRKFSLTRVVLGFILAYRKNTSAYVLRLSRSCIHDPTCSKFTLKAIHRFGLIKGGKLGLSRIYNCSSAKNEGGYDPVPSRTINNERK